MAYSQGHIDPDWIIIKSYSNKCGVIFFMEFCNKCGSLKIKGSCTNKKCDQHIKSMVELATSQQVEYIRELAEQLGEDISELNLEAMSKSDAVDLIDEYLERLDDSEKKLVVEEDILDEDEELDTDEEL